MLEAIVVSTLAFCFADYLTNYSVGIQNMTAASGGTVLDCEFLLDNMEEVE